MRHGPRRSMAALTGLAFLALQILPAPAEAATIVGANGTFTTTVTPAADSTKRDKIVITYTPDPTKVKCKEIYLVQTCRLTDQNGATIEPKNLGIAKFKFLQPDMTPGGTFVDHVSTEKDPYYNGEDTGKDTKSKGSSDGTTGAPTTMSDDPYLSNEAFPAGVTSITATFEVCAICKDDGSILDCITWSWTRAKNAAGMGTITDAAGPAGTGSQEFKDAKAKFEKNHKNGTVCPEETAEKNPAKGDAVPGNHKSQPITPHPGQSTQMAWHLVNRGGTSLPGVPWQVTLNSIFGTQVLAAGTASLDFFDYQEIFFNVPPLPPGTIGTLLLEIDPAGMVLEYDETNNNASLTIDASGIVYEGSPLINEIRTDQPGADVDEYFELRGQPFASLENLTYVVLGDGNSITRCGLIESVVPLSTLYLQPDGLFAAARSPLPALSGYDLTDVTAIVFENTDNVTHMIVAGFSGTVNQDLDFDDDGVLDVTPWTSVVDGVAPFNAMPPNCATISNVDWWYTPNTVGPDGAAVPMMVWRCADTGLWQIGPAAMPPTGFDTPGEPNQGCLAAPPNNWVQSRLPCVPLVGQSATVRDSITGANTVDLVYSVNGGPSTSVPMADDGDNNWEATIPAQFVNGTRIAYHVEASNEHGTDTGSTGGYFVGVMNVSDLRVNDLSGVNIYNSYGVRVAGSVTAAQGSFSTVNTDFFVQDLTGGINVFALGTVHPAGLGDDVEVAGSLDQFNGRLEITDSEDCGDLTVEILGPGNVPPPQVIGACQIDESREGLLVRVVTPVDTTGNNSPDWQANRTYPIIGCSPEARLFIDGDTGIAGTPIVSTMVGVTGISSQFDTSNPFTAGHQIVPRNLSDIEYVTGQIPEVVPVFVARLESVTPNPFRQSTQFSYQVPGRAGSATVPVRLQVFDVSGRLLATLVDGARAPGSYTAVLNSSQIPGAGSGLLFARLEVNGITVDGRKIVMIR